MAPTSPDIYCIFRDCLVFQGHRGRSAMHAHHYLQYGASPSAAFELRTPEWSESRRLSSFMIPSDRPHQLRLSGKDPVIMVWLDPESRVRSSLSRFDEIRYPLQELETRMGPLYHQPLTCESARQIRDLVTGQTAAEQQDLDDRISAAVEWIGRHLHEQTITTEQLAGEIYLSPGRFMHLFSEQIGIPVRKYILWQRLRHALLLLAGEHSITEAAHEAGFTDSSHMNRTFNTMFGINPSEIFKNSRFIQVSGC